MQRGHLHIVRSLDARAELHDRMLTDYIRGEKSSGWKPPTINAKIDSVARVVRDTGCYVWEWTPELMRDWASRPAQQKLGRETFRLHWGRIRGFHDFVLDPTEHWIDEVRKAFGTEMRPSISGRAWPKHRHDGLVNTQRAFTDEEVEKFGAFLYQAMLAARKKGRKGMFTAARNFTMFATQVGFALRAREMCWLERTDLYQPDSDDARELLGTIGSINVRWSKSLPGQEPEPHVVLAVPLFSAHIKALSWYMAEIRHHFVPAMPPANYVRPKNALYERYNSNLLFLTENGKRIEPNYWQAEFKKLLAEAGMDTKLVPHCGRHYNLTRLQQNGHDRIFASSQANHRLGATTEKYTHISDEFSAEQVAREVERRIAHRRGKHS